jgi:hypothetical protein
VIHAYSKGWGDGTAYDIPLPGAIAGLKKLMEDYAVFILSTRDAFQILEWFEKYAPEIGCDVIGNEKFWNVKGRLGITDRKLAAMVYIDDRAFCFTSWEQVGFMHDQFATWPNVTAK